MATTGTAAAAADPARTAGWPSRLLRVSEQGPGGLRLRRRYHLPPQGLRLVGGKAEHPRRQTRHTWEGIRSLRDMPSAAVGRTAGRCVLIRMASLGPTAVARLCLNWLMNSGAQR